MAHPRPLLLPAPPEPFPGWTNVQEVPGELGGVLLVLYRGVLLWAETPPAERGELPCGAGADDPHAQPGGAPLPDTLAEAVRDLRELRTEPGQARPAAVSRACDAVSAWAEEAGHTGTALAWARAAAIAHPPNVAAAHRVGILARRRADYATAEAWLLHAAAMSRRHGDSYQFALSLNSLGNLHAQHGEFGQARGVLAKALGAARRPRGRVEGGRERLRELEGDILHDLLLVAIYACSFVDAERFAAEAFERMRAGHRRLPVLAHDVALLWMERGHFGRALQVLGAVLPLIQKPQERLLACSNLARCAGADGSADAFARAAAEVWDLIGGRVIESVPAVVYVNVARGAAGLRLWQDAERAAELASRAAAIRQEADQLVVLGPLLDSIRLHRFADACPEPTSPLEERKSRSLAVGLVEALTALRAGE
ncbi:MAG TPA: tetratricopeptide repeat protein [Longimicrobiaceae bacterium]|jgi:tetratricopeptide (TPR) repeat protein